MVMGIPITGEFPLFVLVVVVYLYEIDFPGDAFLINPISYGQFIYLVYVS